MRLASQGGVGLLERNAFRWFRLRKRMRQWIRYRSGMDKTVLFIVGCQRSGTSMMHHLFRLDWDSIAYDEVSPLSDQDLEEGLRLNPLQEVKTRILNDRSPLVVCKPLVESQNLVELLDLFPRTKAIWMYRDFQDVAYSNLEYFGKQTGHKDLAPILADDSTNWRMDKLAVEDREIIAGFYEPGMKPYDAAALFWYARNSLFFSRGFDKDSRVRTCCYETLVSNPAEVLSSAYLFLGLPYPGDRIVADVFSESRGRGHEVSLSPAVNALCTDLLTRLSRQEGIGP